MTCKTALPLVCAACLLAACAGWASDVFELADGRRIEGRKTGEADGKTTIEIACGKLKASIQVASNQIKSVSPAKEAPPAKAPPAAPKKEEAKPKEAPGPKDDSAEWDRARLLLMRFFSRPVEFRSALPYGMDPCEEVNYGLYREGVWAENFKGLQYRYGVLPGLTWR